MKLRLARMSGRPVSVENLTQYEEEFKKSYDKIVEEHAQDMLKVHEELQKLDNELQSKWQRIEAQDLPKSALGWKKLIDHFEAPVMLARSAEDPKELLIIIMDTPIA